MARKNNPGTVSDLTEALNGMGSSSTEVVMIHGEHKYAIEAINRHGDGPVVITLRLVGKMTPVASDSPDSVGDDADGGDTEEQANELRGDVPSGNIPEILEWVGDDPARALAALSVERDGDDRPTLVAALEDVIEGR